MELIFLILVAYVVMYGGEEIAKEGKKTWDSFKKRTRKNGHPAAKALVNGVAGVGWVGATAGRGVKNGAKGDAALIKAKLSPEARTARQEKRGEKRDLKKQQREATSLKRWEGFEDDPRNPHTNGVAPASTQDGPAPVNGTPADPAGTTGAVSGTPVTAKPIPTPVAPANGATAATSNGGNMSGQPTGEAHSYAAMIAEAEAIAAQARQLEQAAMNMGQAGERLDAAAAANEVDRITRASFNRMTGSAFDGASTFGAIAANATAAARTLQAQQGGLNEAHAAQPEAAKKEFFKN